MIRRKAIDSLDFNKKTINYRFYIFSLMKHKTVNIKCFLDISHLPFIVDNNYQLLINNYSKVYFA